MKIDLSKVQTTTSGNTSTAIPKITPTFDASITTASTTETTTATESHGITYDTSVTSPATNESENSGFSVTFTSGVSYNLDKLISEKQRNSSSCPLIVKVDQKNENDAKIIETIVKLMLTDYEIPFSLDKTASDYYKNQVSLIPDYYNVFDSYFNKLYGYYQSQYTALYEGSVSLSLVVENIQGIQHTELLEQLTTGISDEATGVSPYLNKTKVQWEMGTQDSDSTSDSTAVDEISALTDKVQTLTSQLSTMTNDLAKKSNIGLKASETDDSLVLFWYDMSKYNEKAGKTGLSEDGETLIIDMTNLSSDILGTDLGDTLQISLLYDMTITGDTAAIKCYNW